MDTGFRGGGDTDSLSNYFPQRGGEIWIHDLLKKSVFSEAADPHASNSV